jgi:hypothetical protein
MASSTAKDLTAGTVGGIAQVLVGQPFDIVKVVRTPYALRPLVYSESDTFCFCFPPAPLHATAHFRRTQNKTKQNKTKHGYRPR